MLTGRPRALVDRCWNSPTLMTWGSFLAKSLSLVVVLPLLLTRLATAEISLWYLFATIIGLQSLVDVGFSPTFSRFIAYGMGGTEIRSLDSPTGSTAGEPNWETVASVKATMRTIFVRLGLLWTFLLVTIGTISLIKPVSALADRRSAWICWGVILVVSSLTVQGNGYAAYLQGVNQIALLRRWETITALCGIASSFLVLFAGGGLVGLVVANQGWQLVSVVRNWWLVRALEGGRPRSSRLRAFDRTVFDAAWPSAWRSGLGVVMSYGLIQVSGILYAQVGTPGSVASYLLGLRLIQTVVQFSQAPFYSKIPLLARLYAEDRREELVRQAKRGMALSHWTYVAGFIGLGVAGGPFLRYIGSHAPFPEPLLWSLMGLGYFIERYGAMHIQLYSTTNRIIWHIANGVTGIIYISVSLLLFERIGVFAFPVGIVVGYLGFYSWYAARYSYRAFGMRFVSFEKGAALAPVAMVLFYIAIRTLV